jgi:hypothetical protein
MLCIFSLRQFVVPFVFDPLFSLSLVSQSSRWMDAFCLMPMPSIAKQYFWIVENCPKPERNSGRYVGMDALGMGIGEWDAICRMFG